MYKISYLSTCLMNAYHANSMVPSLKKIQIKRRKKKKAYPYN
jgi:hypothetical protein